MIRVLVLVLSNPPASLHVSIQCRLQRVKSAGLDSVRLGHAASAGSMLSTMCSPARTRLVKNSNGFSMVPTARVLHLSTFQLNVSAFCGIPRLVSRSFSDKCGSGKQGLTLVRFSAQGKHFCEVR
jgi:hypothetical protein